MAKTRVLHRALESQVRPTVSRSVASVPGPSFFHREKVSLCERPLTYFVNMNVKYPALCTSVDPSSLYAFVSKPNYGFSDLFFLTPE